MTLRQSIIFIFFVLTTISLVNAQSITGKIISTENIPIPYATIQIGENHGTISNEEGDFTISTENFTEEDFVKISCLGFETIEIALNKFSSKEYILENRFDVLTEVYLTNKKLTVEDILKKVRDSISINYSNNSQSQIFYRGTAYNTPKEMDFEILKASKLNKKTIKSLNSKFENLRDFAQNKTTSYYTDVLLNYSQLKDSVKINVTKATKLINQTNDNSIDKLQNELINIIINQLDSSATYKVKSGFFKFDDSLKVGNTFNLNKDVTKTGPLAFILKSSTKANSISEDSYFSFIFNDSKNKYKLDGISYFDNKPVYKISFTPKRKSEKFAGVFYVNTKDFAVLKVDYKLAENRYGKRLNLKFLAGIKFSEHKINGSVLFEKGEDGYYKPKFINVERQQYVYLSRPIKFIKNIVNEDDEKATFKFKFKFESSAITKEELYFIETSSNTEAAFNKFKIDEEYQVETIKAYNPEIWKDYKIISPVESIKNYHLED